MNAALPASGSILNDVRCILVEQLEHARGALEHQPISDDCVHRVRKVLKRARASLRLLREALGVAEYRRLNVALRDAARPLAQMRDAKVLLQALDTVVEKLGVAAHAAIVSELHQALQREPGVNRAQLQAEEVAVICGRLNAVALSLQNLADASLDRVDIRAAVKRTHKKARKAFTRARRDPSDENLHEWRKQVKYELNQLELLKPLKPKRIGISLRQAHKLADRLGDDHDIAVLCEKIRAQSSLATTDGAQKKADELQKALMPVRAKLQRKARQLGKSLYAGKSWRGI